MSNFETEVRNFVRKGFDHEFGKPRLQASGSDTWRKLSDAGSTLWLDTGDMDAASALWNTEFDALTTNNTLLNNEIQKGLYDNLVGEAAAMVRKAKPGIDEQTLVLEVAFILNAYHGLRLVEQFDARVSVELHTDLSGDVERTVYYGQRYYAICPERFIVKVPLTPAGYLGAGRLRQAGIPINFTLGFSARQNYVAALLTKPAYVNVFMGRLNAFVSGSKLGDGELVGEKATLATQRELRCLREGGRTDTRLIGASVRNGEQIAYLAGLDVFTMPPKAAQEFQDRPDGPLESHLDTDPELSLGDGVALDDFGGATLWDVPDEFRTAVDALAAKGPERLTAEEVEQHFADAGFPDLLPRWSEKDLATITTDGKIPVYETWRDKLASGEIGLDALMNISALCSFATDQKALDDRIRSLLG